MEKQEWVTESHEGYLRKSYRIKEILFSGQSDFQKVEVVDTYGHGKMLFNDGLAMVSERDEFVYHEMIAHVPLCLHPRPRRVLVVGGGDGGTAREVLKHPEVELCTMVEIDGMVVDACKKHIPVTASCLKGHPKLDLKIEDAVKYVAQEQTEMFDVILVDSTDPIGPATPLFGKEFYENVHRLLTDRGVVVSQCESPYYYLEMQKSVLTILKSLFPITQIYNYSNMTYPGGIWSFAFASKGLHPLRDLGVSMSGKSWSSLQLGCSYYNPEIHQAAFCHPQFMKEALGDLLSQESMPFP